MKRYIYYAAFTFLGLLFATLIHAAVEIPTLWLITSDLEEYGESVLWQNWSLIHGAASALLWLLGGAAGLYCGVHYWQVLYKDGTYAEEF